MTCGGKGYTETNDDPATRRPCVCRECLANREFRRTEDLSILQRLERLQSIAEFRDEPATYRCHFCRDTLYVQAMGRSAKFGVHTQGAIPCHGGKCPAWQEERRKVQQAKADRLKADEPTKVDTDEIPF